MNQRNSDKHGYGIKDASFRAAGGEAGIRELVDRFFERMATDSRFATIYEMHPDDIDLSRDKLARFLCGWLGGPKLFQERYGPISIPKAHGHLPVSSAERDQWLTCMQESIDEQPYKADFKTVSARSAPGACRGRSPSLRGRAKAVITTVAIGCARLSAHRCYWRSFLMRLETY